MIAGILAAVGLAVLGYGVFKRTVPTEAPKVDQNIHPYASGGMRLNFDKSIAKVGKPVPVMIEWGPEDDAEGGEAIAIVDRFSPDGNRAALRWTDTDYSEMVPGQLYWADSKYPPSVYHEEIRQRALAGETVLKRP